MDSSDILQLVILILLLLLSAFFSASETALLTSNKMKMRSRAEAGDKKAERVIKLCDDQDRMLGAILIGNNIVNLFAASLATTLAMNIWGSKAVALATGILTLLVLVFGEITPKSIATRYADSISCAVAGTLDVLATILKPLIWLVGGCSDLVMKLLGMNPKKVQDAITEEELRTIVEVSQEEGVIESDEKEMITNVVDFGDTVAKDIMVPKVDMVCVSEDAPYEELLTVFRGCRYTRFPVFRESPDTIVGILNVKDILLHDENSEFAIKDHMREPFYTYEFKNTRELMSEMMKACESVAIVLNEYGTTAGMVTMEDMLEEIVGEIRDEYDYDETENVVKVGDNEYIVKGSTKPEELNEKFDLKLDEEENESVAGVIMGILGHVPEAGEEVRTKTCRMVVESMDKMRIDKVRLYILAAL